MEATFADDEISNGTSGNGQNEPATFLTIVLGNQHFALSVAPVREILDEQPAIMLPETSPDVVGLIDVRGEGVVVYDISPRLGVNLRTESHRRIVVLESSSAHRKPVGILADEVRNVIEISSDEIETAPDGYDNRSNPGLVLGVARLEERLVLIIDHDRLLGSGASSIFDFPQ